MAGRIIQSALQMVKTGIPKRQPMHPNLKELNLQSLLTSGKAVVTMVRGEGCGPELTSYVEEVFEAAEVPVSFDVKEIQAKTPEQREENLESAIRSIRKTGVAITGFLDKKASEKIGNSLLLNIILSRNQSHHTVESNKPAIDNILIRSSRQYSNLESARSIDIGRAPVRTVTQFVENTEKLTRFAFELARRENRLKLTTVHETIGEKASDVISLDIIERIAEEYFPYIKYTNVSLNQWLRQLAQDPSQYDVLLLHNFHPGLQYDLSNWIEDTTVFTDKQSFGTQVLFEAMDKKYTRNPIPLLNAAVHLLEHLGLKSHAKVIKYAIHVAVCHDGVRTRDLGGSHTGRAVVDAINNLIFKTKVERSSG